jgi:hypothetical protein
MSERVRKEKKMTQRKTQNKTNTKKKTVRRHVGFFAGFEPETCFLSAIFIPLTVNMAAMKMLLLLLAAMLSATDATNKKSSSTIAYVNSLNMIDDGPMLGVTVAVIFIFIFPFFLYFPFHFSIFKTQLNTHRIPASIASLCSPLPIERWKNGIWNKKRSRRKRNSWPKTMDLLMWGLEEAVALVAALLSNGPPRSHRVHAEPSVLLALALATAEARASVPITALHVRAARIPKRSIHHPAKTPKSLMWTAK